MEDAIDITSSALAFIKQHGGIATVRLSPRYGCCGGSAHVVVADASSPTDPALYQRHPHEDITLFIDSTLAYQGLKISVEGVWKLRHLYVEGASLSPR